MCASCPQCRLDYKLAYQTHKASPTQHSLTMYLDTHNAYVQQLHATNAMLEAYHSDTLPQLLQELEDIYNDLCTTVSESVLQSTEVISLKVRGTLPIEGVFIGQTEWGNFKRIS